LACLYDDDLRSASAYVEDAMILKDLTWRDNNVAGLIRGIRMSAKGLKLGVLRPAPVCRTEQQGAGANSSNEAKKETKEA
jgi:hypothetical protein